MPLYFYHLKIELYPYPRPPSEREVNPNLPEAWVPPPGSDIFQTRDWPRHQRIRHLGEIGEAGYQLDPKEYEYLTGGRKKRSGSAADEGAIIDCGACKGSPPNPARDSSTEKLSATRSSATTLDPPPLNPLLVVRDRLIALQDYRFGQVRVESVDIVEMGDKSERPGGRRGESSIGNADGISAGLAGGDSAVRVTKGRFEQLDGKNTEAGWGIVHLYRDGEETLGLNGAVASGAAGNVSDEHKVEEQMDCTTLCIPAVPTYLTYNDFLGFAGKKAIEEISHFRMLMTGRSNRYMVLMKFRDSKAARRWKAEYDGKLFIEMEVGSPLLLIT
jgi:BRCA1-associated protein